MNKHRASWKKRLIYTIAVLLALRVLYRLFLFPALLHWGATAEEYNKALPGDELLSHKDYKNTLAVTVHAPPSEIWPWIAQMGLHKGGFYSYTMLENLFGCNLHNANQIHAEWQKPQVGAIEPVCQSAEGKPNSGWQIVVAEERRALVWKGVNDAQWMVGVYIDSVDAHTSRLITRQQFEYPHAGSLNWWLEKLWFEWAHCIMQRGMINGIKERVEQASTSTHEKV